MHNLSQSKARNTKILHEQHTYIYLISYVDESEPCQHLTIYSTCIQKKFDQAIYKTLWRSCKGTEKHMNQSQFEDDSHNEIILDPDTVFVPQMLHACFMILHCVLV